MIIVKEKTSINEGAITPGMHEENVRTFLKQARTLADDVYTRSYKVHQNITRYLKMAYDADLAETAKDLSLFMKDALAIKDRETQRRG